VDNHTYAIVDTSAGACLAPESFPTTAAAIGRAIAWMKRITNGNVLAAVEGTSSYGGGLSRALRTAGIPVAEVKPRHRQARAGAGKSDPIDAVEAARQVLHQDVEPNKADGGNLPSGQNQMIPRINPRGRLDMIPGVLVWILTALR
jgi:transposase